jgi:hypothetical protein
MILLSKAKSRGTGPMEAFNKLFGSLLAFVYHCFDRIVIQGYLLLLTREEHIVHSFRDVLGLYPITKDILSRRTTEYKHWVEAFARNHKIPMEWAQKGVWKEDYVRPHLQRMQRRNRSEVLQKGARCHQPARAYSLNQIEYCRNFIFRSNFPIHKVFERSCEMGLFRLTGRQGGPDLRRSRHQKNTRKTLQSLPEPSPPRPLTVFRYPLAVGRPVSTSVGCEGLDVVGDEHLLIADDTKLFAEQVVKLLRHNDLRTRIVAKVREFGGCVMRLGYHC